MTKPWTTANIPDQTGRLAIVTGANSGIGFEAAKALAGKGARVILATRSEAKGQQALQAILAKHPQAELDPIVLDLADLRSIRAFCDQYRLRYERLDLLINNAGVMAIPYRVTADGFEMQFGSNHLGHFVLTGLLLETLLRTPGARVVTVSSSLHHTGRIDFDDLMGQRHYGKRGAYAQSKLANLLFAYELDRRLKAAEASTISLGVHPGYAATNLQEAGPRMEGSVLGIWVMRVANRLFAQSAAMGALPTLYAATAPGLRGGEYIGPTGLGGMYGYPGPARSNARSHDRAAAARLWQISETLTGVNYAALGDRLSHDRMVTAQRA